MRSVHVWVKKTWKVLLSGLESRNQWVQYLTLFYRQELSYLLSARITPNAYGKLNGYACDQWNILPKKNCYNNLSDCWLADSFLSWNPMSATSEFLLLVIICQLWKLVRKATTPMPVCLTRLLRVNRACAYIYLCKFKKAHFWWFCPDLASKLASQTLNISQCLYWRSFQRPMFCFVILPPYLHILYPSGASNDSFKV